MKADKPFFIGLNIGVSLVYAALFWLFVQPPNWVVLPFFLCMLHMMASKARAREINARLKMNSAMIAEFLEKVPGFSMEEYLEDFGLDENDIEDE